MSDIRRTRSRTIPGAMNRRLPRLLTILGAAAICMGATSQSCSLPNLGGGGSSQPSFVTNLQIQDATGAASDTFTQGETIRLVLTVRNRLNTSASVEFTTARQSDFVVVPETSSVAVWKWSSGRAFEQVATKLDFAAGETKTFTVNWNQVGSNNAPVLPGTYEARGVLVYAGFDTDPLQANEMGSTLQRFVIVQ